MGKTNVLNNSFLNDYLVNFVYCENDNLFERRNTAIDTITIDGKEYPRFTNEFWTAKQRQANNLHEIAYRACFKPQLPNFFINLLTKPDDIVYDPFSGRGTTIIEAALLNRNVVSNDINPISKILTYPRLFIPDMAELEKRLYAIPIDEKAKAELDISMFYHPETEAEVVSLRNYLKDRKDARKEDAVDAWIRMVATNRLSGHSSGFFSVYTLPPNQAVSAESQKKINAKKGLKPEYRDTKKLILKKTQNLLGDVTPAVVSRLRLVGEKAVFLAEDARHASGIMDESVQLTVTSPPFLDVVQYADDNWLRCWFNSLDSAKIGKGITIPKKVEDWRFVMGGVFQELYRITKNGGYVAFEVGEVRGGQIKLEEHVAPLGVAASFSFEGVMINEQEFTKTANIWGVSNNKKGTNTNRIVIFKK